jgi:alkanesulfonate monooxygenase SsuD/methylene tetrahydromethanopterin reductase-like flavin-dependent oxidoreductase (luciferase family)
VLFQAGSSEVGREVAARFAEGVFTPQHTLAGAQEFYRDLKERMRKYRPPAALKVMPGLNAIVGRTRKEANELHHFLQSKIHPDVGLELPTSFHRFEFIRDCKASTTGPCVISMATPMTSGVAPVRAISQSHSS